MVYARNLPSRARGARHGAWLAALAFAAACNDKHADSPTPPFASGTSGAPSSASGTGASSNGSASAGASAAPLIVGPSHVGGACSQPDAQAECDPGLMCLPAPGGYCTGFCSYNAGCPSCARCTPTVRAGELCLQSCERDADCRTDYLCDPAWKVCMHPGFQGFIGPKVPACAGGGSTPKHRSEFAIPQLLSSNHLSRYSFEPTATLMPSGEIVVAYTAMNGMLEPNGLETTVLHTDGSFDVPRPFTSDRKRHFDPWLTTHDGQAVLVWLGHDGGHPDRNAAVGMAKSRDGVHWSAPVDVLDGATDCPNHMPGCADKPMVATNGKKGGPLVVFYYSEATEGLRARSAPDGTTFGPSVPVAGGAYGSVTADASGKLYLAVQDFLPGDGRPNMFGDARSFVALTSSSDGGATWQKPERASAEGDQVPFYFSNAQVLVDTQRQRGYVVYPRGSADGAWDIVIASRTLPDGKWTTRVVNDDAHCANHMKPAAALDPVLGGVHMVWTENRGSVGRVVYARCAPIKDGMHCEPNEQVSDSFSAYSFVRHAPSWLGEYDAVVIDPARRLFHVIYTAPGDEQGVATSRVYWSSMKMD